MKKSIITLVCTTLLLCLPNSYSNAQLKQDVRLVKGKLDNGLTYYIYPNDNPKGEAIYRLFIKSGSLYENQDQRGLAHFLEHMAFNGSVNFPDGALIGYLQSKGAGFGSDINAHTSMNETVYKLRLPSLKPSFVDTTLMILADWAGGLTLDSAAIEKERGIILSEWLTKEGPKNDVNTAFLMELLNGSKYSERRTIGDTAILKKFTHDKLRNYYNDWYNPKLMAVAVVGDVDPAFVERVIKERFSGIPSAKIKVRNYKIDNYKKPQYKAVGNAAITEIELNVIQLIPLPEPVKDEKSYKKSLERSLVNSLISNRFSYLWFSDPSYKKASLSASSFMNVKGILLGSVGLKPDKVMSGIREYAFEAEQIYRYGFLSSEIEKAQKNLLNSLKRRSESQKPKLSELFMNEIYSDFFAGKKLITDQDEYLLAMKYISTIDSASIVKYLHQLRKPKQTRYFLTYNDKIADQLPKGDEILHIIDSLRLAKIERFTKNMTIPDSFLPEEPAGGEVIRKEYIDALGAYRLQLSNGAFVTVKQTDLDKDRLSVSGFRLGGLYALDSVDYVSGYFAWRVVPSSGAGEFSRDALYQATAGSSASANFAIAPTRTGIIAGATNEDIERVFELLYLKWRYPRLDTILLEQIKRTTIENVRNEIKTDADKFRKNMGWALNGKDYTSVDMTDSLIAERLSIDRILPSFDRFFGSAKDYEFIILGKDSLDVYLPYIEKYLGGLPGGQIDNDYRYHRKNILKKDSVMIEHVGDNPKAEVAIFFQTDRSVAEMRRHLLIGNFVQSILRNRLLDVLREKMNMVYSVSASTSAIHVPDHLNRVIISFSSKPEDVDTLIHLTMMQLNDMARHTDSFTEELSKARLNIKKIYEVERQNNSYWSAGIRDVISRKDEDWSYLTNYDEIIDSVTAEEVSDYIKIFILDAPMLKTILLPRDKIEENILPPK